MAESIQRYTKDHEWARNSAEGVYVGISDYAQKELGDVVFVDLPDAGVVLGQGKSFATVESVKAVSEIYAPLDGEVIRVNTALAEKPELVNLSPEKDGWIVLVKPTAPAQLEELMDSGNYGAYVAQIAK
ncbi:MAG TPA: glycine cleavage system protein GcvH [Oligoflexia bacterium]|nr:glycine cleavage system protein GcvH [Oligoflexia bacterium]